MARFNPSIEVSDEYLQGLCDFMLTWAEKESSLTMPQFLKERGIGQYYFNHFRNICPALEDVYERVKAFLHERWLLKAMSTKEMPQHQAKILMKYLSLYDTHYRDLMKREKDAEAVIPQHVQHHFESENYGDRKLDGIYESTYEKNADKRGSSKKA